MISLRQVTDDMTPEEQERRLKYNGELLRVYQEINGEMFREEAEEVAASPPVAEKPSST